MRKVIYLHGFASSGNSIKGDYFRETYKEQAITPSLSCHPNQDIIQIENIIKQIENPILIGSSLGGFYAEYLSKTHHLDALLINPLTQVEDIKPFVGRHQYYETGNYFDFTLEDYNNLIILSETLYNYKTGNEKRDIIVSKDDDVIPYKNTIKHFIYSNETVTTYKSGGHSFNNLEIISVHLEKLHN